MKRLLSEQRYFLLLMLLFIIAGGILILETDKGDIVRWFANNRTPFLNGLFYYITYLGAEAVPVIILSFLLWKVKYAIFLGAANVIVSIVIRFLKNIVFPTYSRPKIFFEELGEMITFVDGVHLNSYFSFPSGHSASGFALFFGISLMLHRKWLGIPAFILALIVGLSRPYLVQHFFVDIYVGAIISVVLTFLIFYWIDTRVWYGSHWANKPLFSGWNWHKRNINKKE